jgi:glycosyltransferase involved in cell wall biosynthesis
MSFYNKKKQLIMHVITGLGIGGAELMLKRLLEFHILHPRWRHSVISLTSIGPIGDELRANGIKVWALGLRSPAGVPLAFLKIIFLLLCQRPAIVQTWLYHSDLLGGIAARMVGCKNIIWGIRTTDLSKKTLHTTLIVRWLCARLSSWVPSRIVCAAETSRQSHIALGYRSGCMVVVPNGFDLSRFRVAETSGEVLRTECGWGEDILVIGCLGRFNPDKDFKNFVAAAGKVAQLDSRARFLMIGRDLHKSNTELIHWIHDTGYADRFVLLGERSDVPRCLAAMDIFVLSSRTEGFPNVVGEAMAMQVPCVVTNVGDAALLVGQHGVVVPPEDPGILAAGMTHLLQLTHEERRAIGSAARTRIQQKFSMECCAANFEAVYVDVLKDIKG